MSTRNNGATAIASRAVDNLSPYVDRFTHDEKLRQRLIAAVIASAAGRRRVKRQAGLAGLVRRLEAERALRAQVAQALAQLQRLSGRAPKNRSHKRRNFMLFLAGAGMVAAALPSVRSAIATKARGAGDDWQPGGDAPGGFEPSQPANEEQEIPAEVPAGQV
jgi:hypothetical protein